LTLDEAAEVLRQIEATKIPSLSRDVLRYAVRYSRLRVDWLFADGDRRREIDAARSAAHTAFIDACNILARNMAQSGEDASWRVDLGQDRKSLGDFACLVHTLLGLRAR